jgi:hypothetical protein
MEPYGAPRLQPVAINGKSAAAIVIVIGFAIGFRPDGGAAGMLAAVALLLVFSFSIAWIWTALALLVRTPSAVSNISLLIVFPLTFASNVLVDPRRSTTTANPRSRSTRASAGVGSTPTSSAPWPPASASYTTSSVRAKEQHVRCAKMKPPSAGGPRS